MKRRHLVRLAALAASLLPAALAAQECTAGGGFRVSAAAGLVHYGVSNGVDGVELGGELGASFAPVAVTVGYHRLDLERGEIDPDVIRGRIAVRIPTSDDFEYCGSVFGGMSLMSPPDGGGTDARVVAGGAGLHVARPLPRGAGVLRPFAGIRGGAASSSGEVLGLDVSETGYSFGGDVGAVADIGRFTARAEASFDGFAPALGISPYPDRAFRLAAGFRF